jgi:apolipoprotein D and lipocalin family protein
MRKRIPGLSGCLLLAGITAACAANLPPIQPVAHVDLSRYMGRWYVIAEIPTRFERHARNAVETYRLEADGNIYTTFRFNNGSAHGPLKHIHSTGYVRPGTGNAVWSVQVFWPFKAQYIVAYLKPDYSEVIVARDARDYAWVMARTPHVSAADWRTLTAKLRSLGYDMHDLRRVPQEQQPAPRPTPTGTH